MKLLKQIQNGFNTLELSQSATTKPYYVVAYTVGRERVFRGEYKDIIEALKAFDRALDGQGVLQ